MNTFNLAFVMMKTFLEKKAQTSPIDTATANHCTAFSPLTYVLPIHKVIHNSPASQPASPKIEFGLAVHSCLSLLGQIDRR